VDQPSPARMIRFAAQTALTDAAAAARIRTSRTHGIRTPRGLLIYSRRLTDDTIAPVAGDTTPAPRRQQRLTVPLNEADADAVALKRRWTRFREPVPFSGVADLVEQT